MSKRFFFLLSLGLCIFVVYLHIMKALLVEPSIELFEGTYESRKQLSTMCAARQPVVFTAPRAWRHLFPLLSSSNLEAGCVQDVRMRSCSDPRASTWLVFQAAAALLGCAEGKYFSDRNPPLHVAGAARALRAMADDLRPFDGFRGECDLWLGSPGAETPLRHHTDARLFLVAVSGEFTVRMCPFAGRAHFAEETDYTCLEFRGAHNPWNQTPHHHSRLRFKECTLRPGEVIFIPPRVWFSVKYSETRNTLHQIAAITFSDPSSIATNFFNLYCNKARDTYCQTPQTIESLLSKSEQKNTEKRIDATQEMITSE